MGWLFCGEGGYSVGCAPLPLSPFLLCPRPLSLPFGLLRPVPWILRYFGPSVDVRGFGHYVGRPPEIG